jgi:parallel beta-helix repeat protein
LFAVLATMLGAGFAVLMGPIAVPAAEAPIPTPAQSAVIGYDSYNRAVPSGLGSAEIGGAYSVSDAAVTAVNGGDAGLSLSPGKSLLATLPDVSGADVRSRISLVLDPLPKSGNGVYLSLVLRAKAGGMYLAKAHITPTGAVGLSFSRLSSSGEQFLGGERAIAQKLTAGATLTFEAEAIGSSTVSLHSHAWVGSGTTATTASQTWAAQATDAQSTNRADAGSVGFLGYLSRSSAALTIWLTEFSAWRLDTLPSSPPPAPTSSSSASSATPSPTTPSSTSSAPTTSMPSTPSATPTSSATTSPAPPVAAGTAGSAPIGSTSYSIPAGALYVAPNGSDSGSGTLTYPLRTIGRAVELAPGGGTIVLRAGTYHERVEIPATKPVTIESATHEAVWLDGSSAVQGWTHSGSTWVHAGWTAQFDSTPSYTSTVPTGPNWGFVDPAFPMAAHPDQVWVDGAALKQVGSASAVTAGTFYVDYTNDRLIIGTDPSNHAVRASDIGIAMTVNAPGSIVRGIGIRRYATAVHDMGAVRLTAANIRVENVAVTDMATTGLSALNSGIVINHVTYQRNGMLGMHANEADALVVSNVLSEDNNTEHFNQSPVAGGLKFSRTRGVTVADSVIRDNLASGLWLDESVSNATVIGNTIQDNGGNGFFFEISAVATVADNTIVGNSGDGMKINNSNQVRAWNNEISGNGRNIELVQDSRDANDPSTPGHDPRRPIPDPTMTWQLGDVQIMNSILGTGPQYHVYIRDYTNTRSASQMRISIDGNLFDRSDKSGDAEVVWQATPTTLSMITTVTQLAATGAGSHNGETTSATTVTSTAAVPQPIPADIAALIGQPSGARNVGPF